jgi:hypothetical protein
MSMPHMSRVANKFLGVVMVQVVNDEAERDDGMGRRT